MLLEEPLDTGTIAIDDPVGLIWPILWSMPLN